MSQVNIRGLVRNLSDRISVYTPIIEGIVNSIQAMPQDRGEVGEIRVVIKRSQQQTVDSNSISPIRSLEIHDNGIGFTLDNRTSFDTLYSEMKIEEGGKGFGRVVYLKFFENARIVSHYQDGDDTYRRSFDFTGNDPHEMIENESNEKTIPTANHTILYLNNFNQKYSNSLEKKIETIARQLVERLLVYFIDDGFKCPKISLTEEDGSDEIVLNNYFKEYDAIQEIAEEDFSLTKDNDTEQFRLKIFKIYFSKSRSSIILTAHNRAVTNESLAEYIPEFQGDFYDPTDANKNYVIKAYVLGDYLNNNVAIERDAFMFPNAQSSEEQNLIYPFTRTEIESKAARTVAKHFEDELASRQEKKLKRIQEYVDNEAPWYKDLLKDFDISKLPYFYETLALEGELHKLKYQKEAEAKAQLQEILKNPNNDDMDNKIRDITGRLTKSAKSDLAHYVASRRVVLDVFKESLRWNDDKKYEKEKTVHDIIFPMQSDSDTTAYDDHNLWIIDERLSFTEYVSSDQQLKPKGKRPDLLIFNNPIAYREGEEPSNPITIFEFKRPQREEYSEDENPIKQVGEYIKKIRSGEMRDVAGRDIKANKNTPAYCFVICDLTPKIRSFCDEYQLTKSPDGEGYFGYHNNYDMYVEVVSFDKIVRDAELRNRIFFKKLGVE